MFTRSIGEHLYGGKKEMPLPNCICNSDDITAMFISRYIFDIDRMKPDIPEFRADLLYHVHSWLVPFTIRELRKDIIQRCDINANIIKIFTEKPKWLFLSVIFAVICISISNILSFYVKNIMYINLEKNRSQRKRQMLHATFLPGSELLI